KGGVGHDTYDFKTLLPDFSFRFATVMALDRSPQRALPRPKRTCQIVVNNGDGCARLTVYVADVTSPPQRRTEGRQVAGASNVEVCPDWFRCRIAFDEPERHALPGEWGISGIGNRIDSGKRTETATQLFEKSCVCRRSLCS